MTANAVITEVVKRQMISDLPGGAFLSGGIDSPLVVEKMKAAGTGAIRAFTMAVKLKR